jgi:hypothetical protein
MEPETELENVDDGAQGRPESDTSGDSELDSLLQEFEQGTTARPKAKPAAAKPSVVRPDLSELNPVIEFAKTEMQNRKQEAFNTDVDKAVDTLASSESFTALPKELVRDLLVAHAFNDPAFDEAFQNRAKNPSGWEAALKAAEPAIAKKVGGLTPAEAEAATRDDIEAATATVADTSDPSDDDVDEGPSVAERIAMTDTEWRRYLEAREAHQ